jgi:hypothetical protein
LISKIQYEETISIDYSTSEPVVTPNHFPTVFTQSLSAGVVRMKMVGHRFANLPADLLLVCCAVEGRRINFTPFIGRADAYASPVAQESSNLMLLAVPMIHVIINWY